MISTTTDHEPSERATVSAKPDLGLYRDHIYSTMLSTFLGVQARIAIVLTHLNDPDQDLAKRPGSRRDLWILTEG